MLSRWYMWVSTDIQIFYTLKLNNVHTPFSGKMVFFRWPHCSELYWMYDYFSLFHLHHLKNFSFTEYCWKFFLINNSKLILPMLKAISLKTPWSFVFYVVIYMYMIFLWAVKACMFHDVVKWKHFPRYWPFVRGIHQSLVNTPHKVQWLGTLRFSLICAWTNSWVNNQYGGDLRHHHARYDFTVMPCPHVRMRLDLEMQFIRIWMVSLYFMSQVS